MLWSFLPCGKTAFYEHFPNETNDRKDIDELLERNRIEVKTSMRSKWYKSEAPCVAVKPIQANSHDRRTERTKHEQG